MGWTDYIPGVGPYNTAKSIYNKDYKGAARAATTGSGDPVTEFWTGGIAKGADKAWGWGSGKASEARDAASGAGAKAWELLNRPYEDKKQGLAEIQSKIGQLKEERLGRKDDLYKRASAAYDPHRQAMQSVYGDPRTWKL